METIFPIFAAIAFLGFLARRLNKKDSDEEVRIRYQQINARQMEDKKNRRPVGFTTNMNTDKPEQE